MGDLEWDEIRRLASDLQRAQLSGTVQRLSERNCVEIVMKLTALKMLDVLHTTDGKEYLTPQQLCREMKDELFLAGGRISLVELAKNLTVDYSHVETQASNVVRDDPEIHLTLGQLIDSEYLDKIAEEMNESLQQKGTISISTLTKDYDLPSDFLQEQILKRLGSIIEGFQNENDSKEILTLSHVARNRAKIRGTLSAITVPTNVLSILQKFDFEEHLFFSLADELIKLGRIKGSLIGGKKASKATYVPQAYQKAQNDWVDNFYNANGYLEYDALSRLGIQDPVAFIKRRFKDITFLPSCCVGPLIVDSIDASVDEVITTNSWLDVQTVLPSILSGEDIHALLSKSIESKKYSSAGVFGNSFIVSKDFIQTLKIPFGELIQKKAQHDVQSGRISLTTDSKANVGVKIDLQDNKKEERRKKAAGGKVGGGVQGRETKTKSTKKKKSYNKKEQQFDSDSDSDDGESDNNPRFMSQTELENKLQSMECLIDTSEILIKELAALLLPEFNKKYIDFAKELHRSAVTTSMHNKRKSLADFSEKCNSVITSIRMFERGISAFTDENVKTQLDKHLAKTLCTDLVNDVFLFAIEGSSGPLNTPEQRLKLLNNVQTDKADPLLKIHKALSSGSVAEFIRIFEENCEAGSGGITIKSKMDKKRDRQLLFNHRQSLLEQLGACPEDDEALILHLVALVSFQLISSQMIHASGKFVPQILAQISGSLTKEQNELLTSYQVKVVQLLRTKTDQEKTALKEELRRLTPQVKSLPNSLKKSLVDS